MKHWPLVHSDHLDLEAFSLDDGGSFIKVVELGVAYACLLRKAASWPPAPAASPWTSHRGAR